MKMKKIRSIERMFPVAGVVLALLCSLVSADQSQPQAAPPRNIIVMIADGCGYNHVQATDLYEHGRLNSQCYHSFPVRYGLATYSTNGHGYAPDQAWTDPDYIREGATDSAAAATAISSGVRTYNGAIGVGADGKAVVHAIEVAEKGGKATGVVTTVQLSHATPAGFVAHNPSRNNYEQIAQQMVERSAVDVIMGCGHPEYDNDGRPLEEPRYRFVGGPQQWRALSGGLAGWGVDADHNGWLDDPWVIIETRADFRALADGPTPKRVFGVARRHTTLQYRRSGDSKEPYDVPFTESAPTLKEMTAAAINCLDDDPEGFFLMVEGGAIDWAGHGNNGPRLIEEMADFNDAVEAAVAWVEENSNWNETLLIVTSDHETGYLTRGAAEGEGTPPVDEPLQSNGRGQMPAMSWHSGHHTNSLVPLYAKGAGASQLVDYVEGTDPRRGAYVSNPGLGQLLYSLLGADQQD